MTYNNPPPNAQSSFLEWEFFMSGIVWIPYSILLLYLFHEHNINRRYPQNIIIFLLALGAIIRTFWYFLYWHYKAAPYAVIMNRVVILLQFSSLSILILMWGRAVKVLPSAVTKLSFKKFKQFHSTERYSAAANKLVEIENRLSFYQRITLLVNIIAWGLILGSLANGFHPLSNQINITTLSAVCFIEAAVILIVGINTGLKIQKEMNPIYVTSSGTPERNQRSISTVSQVVNTFRAAFGTAAPSRGLRIQAQVLRALLTTSTILSICFLIRSLIFWFNFQIEAYNRILDYICYPYFLYQVPELIPTLTLARSISPPNGILRQFEWNFNWLWPWKKSRDVFSEPRQNASELSARNSSNSFKNSEFGTEPALMIYPEKYNSSILNPQHVGYDDENENGGSFDSKDNSDLQRHWQKYENDGLSEYSDYDIDEFVYRTTSFDKEQDS